MYMYVCTTECTCIAFFSFRAVLGVAQHFSQLRYVQYVCTSKVIRPVPYGTIIIYVHVGKSINFLGLLLGSKVVRFHRVGLKNCSII